MVVILGSAPGLSHSSPLSLAAKSTSVINNVCAGAVAGLQESSSSAKGTRTFAQIKPDACVAKSSACHDHGSTSVNPAEGEISGSSGESQAAKASSSIDGVTQLSAKVESAADDGRNGQDSVEPSLVSIAACTRKGDVPASALTHPGS